MTVMIGWDGNVGESDHSVILNLGGPGGLLPTHTHDMIGPLSRRSEKAMSVTCCSDDHPTAIILVGTDDQQLGSAVRDANTASSTPTTITADTAAGGTLPHHRKTQMGDGVVRNATTATSLLRWCVPQCMSILPRGSSLWWWWGVMLLAMCVSSLGMWLIDMSGTRPRTVEEYETRMKGHWGNSLAWAVVNGAFIHLPLMLVLTLLVQAPCRRTAVATTGTGTAEAEAGGEGVLGGGVAIGLDGGNGVWYAAGKGRGGVLGVAGTWCCVSVVTLTVGIAVMGRAGYSVSFLCTPAFGVLYLLPRAAARWLAEAEEPGERGGVGGGHHHYRQRSRKLTSLAARTVFVGVPLAVLQLNLYRVLGVMPAQQLSFIYPYVLTFGEYLVVSKLLNDRVVEGHSDEAMSIVGRWFVAFFEAARVGLLVVLYTTGATTFQSFVLATLNSALLEILGRAGVFAMTWRALKLQFKHGWRGSWCGGPPRPRFRLLPLKNLLGNFKRVYLGCKTDTEVWPLYGLVIMRILGYGLVVGAHDPTTGELLPALRCGVDVIVVVGGGELLTEACMYGVTWAVGRWCPRYSLHIVTVRPHGSLVVPLLMWWHVGISTLVGIGGMGPLVEELVKSGGGGGGG